MKIYEIEYSINLMRCILWQYDSAVNLKSLIRNEEIFHKMQVSDYWEDWYRDVFNLDTANNFGLTIWGIILGVAHEVKIQDDDPKKSLGFSPDNLAGYTNENFHNANFALTDYGLTLNGAQMRTLLKIRVLQLVSNGSAYDINRILNIVFKYSPAYVIDHYDMSVMFTFTGLPTADEVLVIQQAEILKPPAAVKYEIRFIAGTNWGFGEHRMNYHRGNFFYVNH